MMRKSKLRTAALGWLAVFFISANLPVRATDEGLITREQFLLLQKQNEQTQQQLQKQQQLIDSLSRRMTDMQEANARHETKATEVSTSASVPEPALTTPSDSAFHIGNVAISGEGAVGFFKSQSHGQNPNGAFRIDEAKVFLESPIWTDVYFYTELDLATRESTSLGLNVGEFYLDFEDVSKLWGQDRMLNLRAGQFYTPFGEEYLRRFEIDNPLISGSVSDIWGTDAGVELYGKVGSVGYVAAVQNGGGATSQALQGDKQVAGRLSYDAAKWLHVSASGLRTGNLNVANGVSSLWFANGFFRSLGSASTTSFHTDMVEGDITLDLLGAQVNAAGGYINYGDNNPGANNHRDIYYYYVEATHHFNTHFYCSARFSEIFAPQGFPIVGGGPMGQYLFGALTSEYWRLSLGVGYKFNSHLVVKTEYTLNQGEEANGEGRNRENQFAMEAAFKF